MTRPDGRRAGRTDKVEFGAGCRAEAFQPSDGFGDLPGGAADQATWLLWTHHAQPPAHRACPHALTSKRDASRAATGDDDVFSRPTFAWHPDILSRIRI